MNNELSGVISYVEHLLKRNVYSEEEKILSSLVGDCVRVANEIPAEFQDEREIPPKSRGRFMQDVYERYLMDERMTPSKALEYAQDAVSILYGS